MNLRQSILLILRAANGHAITDQALRMGIRSYFPDVRETDITVAIDDAERAALIASNTVKEINRTTWTLTDDGSHLARKL
jgi:hypothetical protein